MRYAAKADLNQKEIVDALRAVGVSVSVQHQAGRGFPDLVCGHEGKSYLLEIKQPGERLTPAEQRWRDAWSGHAATVSSVKEALEAIGLRHTAEG